MAKYRMEATFIPDMGSVSAMYVQEMRYETKEEQALWQINSMRRHDGLPELDELPDAIRFTPVKRKRHD